MQLAGTSSVFASRCLFAANSGGVFFMGQQARLNVTDSDFVGNSALGGGVFLVAGPDNLVHASGCFFDSNLGVFGGGVFFNSGRFTAEHCLFARNAAGANMAGSVGYSAHDSPQASLTLIDCVFVANRGNSVLQVEAAPTGIAFAAPNRC
jgi:hypothetical protein